MESITVVFPADNPPLSVFAVAKVAGISLSPDSSLPSGSAPVLRLSSGWLGMLPGTWAYVSAGAFGRAIIQEESDVGLPGGNGQLLTLGLGLLVTALAATYVTRIAKDAIKDIE